VATTAPTPTITQNGNVFTSSSATGNQWYRNGSPLAGETNPTYTATASGTYRVEVTGAGGCTLQSNDITFTLTPVSNVDPNAIGLTVSPNPSTTGQFNIQFETSTRSNLSIALLNAVGQKVYQLNVPNFSGRFSQQITPGRLAPGIYYLQVQHDKKMYVRKVVME